DAGARAALADRLAAWRADVDAEWGIAQARGGGSEAWVPDRLEYAFTLAAPPMPGRPGELVLKATEYDGAGLAWYSVDLDADPASALGAAEDAERQADGVKAVGWRVRTLLATPLTYPGMPADRFWEMEDA